MPNEATTKISRKMQIFFVWISFLKHSEYDIAPDVIDTIYS